MKTIAVIGLGQFGSQVAINLTQKGFSILALDEEEDVVNEVKDLVTQAIILDSTDEKAMRAVGVNNVDMAIIAIGSNMQSSLLTTALLQKMNIEEIHVRAINSLQEHILESMGIQNVINIEKEMGLQLARTLSSGKISRHIEISDHHSIIEINVPPKTSGKTIKELNLRSDYKINVVGIKQRVPKIDDSGEVYYEHKMSDIPGPDYRLKADDTIILAGTDDNLNKFIKTNEKDSHE